MLQELNSNIKSNLAFTNNKIIIWELLQVWFMMKNRSIYKAYSVVLSFTSLSNKTPASQYKLVYVHGVWTIKAYAISMLMKTKRYPIKFFANFDFASCDIFEWILVLHFFLKFEDANHIVIELTVLWSYQYSSHCDEV